MSGIGTLRVNAVCLTRVNSKRKKLCKYFKNVLQVSMYCLCKKLPWMWIWEVCTRIKPKVSVPWQWNSVNEASMLLPKGASNNFTKTMFSLRDITKVVSDQ